MGDPHGPPSSWHPHHQPIRPDTSSAEASLVIAAPTFSSSFSSFNLRQPPSRIASTPSSFFGVSSAPIPEISSSGVESHSLLHAPSSSSAGARRPSIASSSPSSTTQGVVNISGLRKNSSLGMCEPIYAQQGGLDSPSPPMNDHSALDDSNDADEEVEMLGPSLSTTRNNAPSRGEDSDSPMIMGSPSLGPIGGDSSSSSTRGGATNFARSRTPSDVFSNTNTRHVPPSPAAIAKALQAEQKTPPPFLQRRLYRGMPEDEPSRGSSSDGDAAMGNELGLIRGHDSRSGSGSGEEGGGRTGVVRRAVSRKPNLLPKSKSHLRVLSELRSESGPADLAEVLSEAALHRLSRSGASPISAQRSSISSLNPSSFPLPSADSGLANRFPEQIEEEGPDGLPSPPSSDPDDLALDEAGSDWGGTMSLGGYETEGEEEQKVRASNLWTGFRSGNGGTSLGAGAGAGVGGISTLPMPVTKSPSGAEKKTATETEAPHNSPQTPSWANSARPGKRKLNDDRFEPYATAFKRRAVSPAALSLSPSVASPLLSFAGASNNYNVSSGIASSGMSISTPPATLTSASTFPSGSLPISIPSPTLTATHIPSFLGTRSRAAPPVPSSLSSSAGRPGTAGGGAGFLSFVGRLEKEERNGSEKMGDEISRMSLG